MGSSSTAALPELAAPDQGGDEPRCHGLPQPEPLDELDDGPKGARLLAPDAQPLPMN
jgi:hypothetical protein